MKLSYTLAAKEEDVLGNLLKVRSLVEGGAPLQETRGGSVTCRMRQAHALQKQSISLTSSCAQRRSLLFCGGAHTSFPQMKYVGTGAVFSPLLYGRIGSRST